MISSINKCVYFISFAMMSDYNNIKYMSNMMKSLRSLMLIIILSLRLSLNKVFYIINIK